MGIFNALQTAVSGLQAQSFALDNISGNIANSQTAAYKRTDTSFADLVLGGDLNFRRQVSGSVQAFSRQTNDVGGVVQPANSGTSIAVNGQGFLIVASSLGDQNGSQDFSGDLYTRRGDFEFDRNGYLVNGAGYYLKGIAVDPVTGNRVGSTPEPIRLQNDSYPATVTSSINYRANLPTEPQTTNYDAADPNSWLLDGTITGDVTADQSTAFMASTIPGDAITVYDSTGGAHDVQFRWGKTANGDPTATPPTEDTWAMFYQSDTNATGTDTAWTKVGDYSFDAKGALTSPVGGSTTITGMTLNGANIGNVSVDSGTGLTQYADSNGTTTTKAISQNGNASGTAQSVEIADGGKVNVTYSNGKTRTLFEVPVVTFTAENRLAHLDGGAYAQTVASGAPLSGDASGAIVGSAIELSNVDIADEFTKMIVTQQAYSANTRVVSTADDMLQETLSMIR
ncbi:flagellar hook protein FlgE [Chenggangzhangella methanolivorans]|uniref:Flagellar hook protein FlgE n=1 Tax=Chenggangzhangella methanolivorans TaxID=1437009 RepID=A0A9E6RGG8_9HYPH|nr:flagellar hook protein FlgE [Chenggangzhangella methanolivorans]QZO00996.1 flagellar hook protein FlgE [Chenggangzhangella methanolivorans]